eukprot:SAG22_NODE_433_length_10557_cov_6.586728_9_plen_112_part_00
MCQSIGDRRPVSFLPAAEAGWARSAGSLQVYKGQPDLARSALEQILAIDVGRRPREMEYLMRFDGIVVSYTIRPGTARPDSTDQGQDDCPTVVHAVGVDSCRDEDGRRSDL